MCKCPLGNVQDGGEYNNPGSDLLPTTLPVSRVNMSLRTPSVLNLKTS